MSRTRETSCLYVLPRWLCFVLTSSLILGSSLCAPILVYASTPLGYATDIGPILRSKCFRCHSDKVKKGELNLQSLEGLVRGGESGRIVFPGNLGKSSLIDKIVSGEMPPNEDGKLSAAERLSDSEKTKLRLWVEQGASIPGVDWNNGAAITQHTVKPILLLRCATCHGRQIQQGGLDVRSIASLLEGGKSGPAVIPGEPSQSLLLKRIRAEEMPPRKDLAKYSVKPMTDAEIETVQKWIAAGAPQLDINSADINSADRDESDATTDSVSYEDDPLVSAGDRSFWSFQPVPHVIVPAAGAIMRCPYKFARHGECGMSVSDALPHISSCVDDIALIRSMYAPNLTHEPALYKIHSGQMLPGLPTFGAWVTYALGSENQNQPAYVVLDDPLGLPINRSQGC